MTCFSIVLPLEDTRTSVPGPLAPVIASDPEQELTDHLACSVAPVLGLRLPREPLPKRRDNTGSTALSPLSGVSKKDGELARQSFRLHLAARGCPKRRFAIGTMAGSPPQGLPPAAWQAVLGGNRDCRQGGSSPQGLSSFVLL